MATSIPHTDSEIASMMAKIGLGDIDELFAQIPSALRVSGALDVPRGKSEFEVFDDLAQLAARNLHEGRPYICFAGAGAYDHEIPALTKKLTFRSEFVTAYTPYQPEVAQGVLQALFEYQTFVSRLFGLPVANASLYDGATALVEAINVAMGNAEDRHVAMSRGVNPIWQSVANTYGRGTSTAFHELPIENGITDYTSVTENCGALVVQYPNYFGYIEDLSQARGAADSVGAALIVIADPIALALLKSPGELGADIVVGEGQVFGTPLSFGGPFVGMMAVSESYLRRLPGRLVGETEDADGRRAFVTTLRTREQDIRREKATSNICTNQTLIAIAAAIQMSWLGTGGMRELGQRCYDASHYLFDQIVDRTSLVPVADSSFFREFTIKSPNGLVDRVIEHGYLAGVEGTINGEPCLTLTATEKHSKEQIDAFVDILAKETAR